MERTDFIFTERALAFLDEVQRSSFFETLAKAVPDLLPLISWALGATRTDRDGAVLDRHRPAYALTPTGRAKIQMKSPHHIVPTEIGDIGLWPSPDVAPGQRYVIDISEGQISVQPASR